jgi:hypothetical protein
LFRQVSEELQVKPGIAIQESAEQERSAAPNEIPRTGKRRLLRTR